MKMKTKKTYSVNYQKVMSYIQDELVRKDYNKIHFYKDENEFYVCYELSAYLMDTYNFCDVKLTPTKHTCVPLKLEYVKSSMQLTSFKKFFNIEDGNINIENNDLIELKNLIITKIDSEHIVVTIKTEIDTNDIVEKVERFKARFENKNKLLKKSENTNNSGLTSNSMKYPIPVDVLSVILKVVSYLVLTNPPIYIVSFMSEIQSEFMELLTKYNGLLK